VKKRKRPPRSKQAPENYQLTAASLDVPPAELGAPGRIYQLSAASLDAPPPELGTQRLRQAIRYQGQRLDKAIAAVFPQGLPSEEQAPAPVIADAIEAYCTRKGWEKPPSRKTILRRIKELRSPPT
jgi:hypothetical protein